MMPSTIMFWKYAIVLILQATVSHGKSSARQPTFGLQKQSAGWGLKNLAQKPMASGSQSVRSFVLEMRGGSSYDDDGYGDNRGRPNNYGGYDDNRGFDARDWERDNYQDDRDDNYGNDYSRSGRSNDRYDYDDRGYSSVSVRFGACFQGCCS